jgi:hypothetical protein
MFPFQAGQRVVIKLSHLEGKWDCEELDGKKGEFLGFNRVGYARVMVDAENSRMWEYIALVHPENLSAVEPEEPPCLTPPLHTKP